MPVPLKSIRELLLPGLWAMGAKGSSGAIYSVNVCEQCGHFPAAKWHTKWLCGTCYAETVMGNKINEMPDPVFTLQEINASEDLITKLSNQ